MSSLIERFMARVQPMPSGCYEWTGVLDPQGYGQVSFHACHFGTRRAHRIAWCIQHECDAVPDDLMVLHTCDNRRCVNPEHLYAGTAFDNMRDMVERGRNPDRKGERHPLARLTVEQVELIRHESQKGMRQHDIAIRFGISQTQVSRIVSGVNWAVA